MNPFAIGKSVAGLISFAAGMASGLQQPTKANNQTANCANYCTPGPAAQQPQTQPAGKGIKGLLLQLAQKLSSWTQQPAQNGTAPAASSWTQRISDWLSKLSDKTGCLEINVNWAGASSLLRRLFA